MEKFVTSIVTSSRFKITEGKEYKVLYEEGDFYGIGIDSEEDEILSVNKEFFENKDDFTWVVLKEKLKSDTLKLGKMYKVVDKDPVWYQIDDGKGNVCSCLREWFDELDNQKVNETQNIYRHLKSIGELLDILTSHFDNTMPNISRTGRVTLEHVVNSSTMIIGELDYVKEHIKAVYKDEQEELEDRRE